jgi:hypothetical protein
MRRWAMAMVSTAVAVAYKMARCICSWDAPASVGGDPMGQYVPLLQAVVGCNYRTQTRAFGRSATYRHFTLGLFVAVKAHDGHEVASNRNDSKINEPTSRWPSHRSQLTSTKKKREKKSQYTKGIYIYRAVFPAPEVSVLSRIDRQTDYHLSPAHTFLLLPT